MSRWRIAAVIAPGALASLAALFIDPIPQDPNYHIFADQRVIFEIPHFGDVITNIGFMLAGSIGLARLLSPGRLRSAFATDRERRAWVVFFLGTLLTGLGSGWYHLQPDNARLFWDRLPMTLTFMALLSAMVSERIDARVGVALLGPLVLTGLASVAWWDYTEQQGRGDLRWYGLVQFCPWRRVFRCCYCFGAAIPAITFIGSHSAPTRRPSLRNISTSRCIISAVG